MLKTTRTAKNLSSSLIAKDFKVNSEDGDCENEMIKKSPSKNFNGAMSYLTPDAGWVFTQLRQAFTKALILQRFDPECHIRNEINTSSYAIGAVLSHLINLGQWHFLVNYL